MRLRIEANLGVVDEENGKLIFLIPSPGYASLNEFEALEDFKERIKLAEEIISLVNKGVGNA